MAPGSRNVEERSELRLAEIRGVRRATADPTWDAVLTALLSLADAADVIDWSAVAVDSTSCRVHQHGATLARHRGHHRITRIRTMNPPITLWVVRDRSLR